jgi:hypothetical protein
MAALTAPRDTMLRRGCFFAVFADDYILKELNDSGEVRYLEVRTRAED